MPTPPLRPEQFERYRRHLNLPEFGLEGQQRLLAARVLLIGAGGLGCPLGAVPRRGRRRDASVSSTSTWSISRTCSARCSTARADVGRPKVEVARERILALNPDVEVETHAVRLTSENALERVRATTTW